jgi:hypothetical protein
MAFTIRLRGASGGTIQHEYLCPVHGRFTAEVSRDDVPDSAACREMLSLPGMAIREDCGRSSPWSPSSIATKVAIAGFSRGKSEAPPTKHALTTRDLAEGMPMNEWRAKRRALEVERRRKRNKEMR